MLVRYITNAKQHSVLKFSVWNQSSTSLGWTCGNLVGPPLQVARFFYDLLGSTVGTTKGA